MDPKLNADGRHGRPLPPFAELVEAGKVCALNFPVALNPGLAKAIGVMMKLDFQRTLLQSLPKIEARPEQYSARCSLSVTNTNISPPPEKTSRMEMRSSSSFASIQVCHYRRHSE